MTPILQNDRGFLTTARALWRDRRGSYSIMAALMLPAMAGFAALGTETGLWFYNHQTMQSAADAAAFSAAVAANSGGTVYATQGRAVAARYGYIDGAAGASVTVNRPPLSGAYAGQAAAVEVIVRQPQPRLFSAALTNAPLNVAARAVALSGGSGTGCVLALNPTASVDISAMGNPQVVLNGCSLYDNSNSPTALTVGGSATITAKSVSVVGGVSGAAKITTTDGIMTGAKPISDPYADVPLPNYTPGCECENGDSTLSPGVYCGLTIHGNVTMQPGLYVIDGGSFTVNSWARLTGSGVTLVFTSRTGSDYPTVRINGGARVNLSAAADDTTGPTGQKALKGIVMYMDRNAPTGTDVRLNGGSNQKFKGALYFPKAKVTLTGGSDTTDSGCLQLIADTIAFGGNSNLAINCDDAGTRPIGAPTRLVE